jgi:hypothetical protein
MIFGQLPHGGQFVFQVEVHSLSQPMTQQFRGSAPILPQSSFCATALVRRTPLVDRSDARIEGDSNRGGFSFIDGDISMDGWPAADRAQGENGSGCSLPVGAAKPPMRQEQARGGRWSQ